MKKDEAREKIERFFDEKHDKGEIRKIKNLAMSQQVKLGEKRKLFCRKCFSMNLRVLGVKNMVKRVICQDCKNVMRWKIR